jgi:phage terminase small subunit
VTDAAAAVTERREILCPFAGGSNPHYASRSGGGMVRKHPAVAIKNEALRLMRGYLGEFGLSPSARTRVGVFHPRTRPPDDFFEKMLDV